MKDINKREDKLMKEINKQAVSEVIEILNHSESKITNKIPEKFMQFLYNNSDSEYKVDINFNNENWDDTIKQDTKVILALIYRDYIVSKEEREKLLKEEQKRLDEEEKELYGKYNTDNLFKKSNKITEKVETDNINNMQLIEIKEEQWFKKIWKKIISLFGKK